MWRTAPLAPARLLTNTPVLIGLVQAQVVKMSVAYIDGYTHSMQQDIEIIDPERVAHSVFYSPTVHGTFPFQPGPWG